MKFLTFKPNTALTFSKQVYTKTPIFLHFNPKYYIKIKTNILYYTINKILNQIILDYNYWHLVVYF